MKNRLFIVSALILLLAGAAAWAYGGRQQVSEVPVVDIRMVLHTSNYEVPLVELAKQYSEATPGVNVTFEVIPNYDSTWEKTQLSAGTAPDIFFTHNMVEYGQQGLVLALDKALSEVNPYSGRIWMNDFVPGNIERYAAPDGTPYMVPLDMVQQAVFYNKSVLDEFGLVPPDTWSEWIAIMDKLQAEGYIPLSINGAGASGSTFVWSERVMTDAFMADKFDRWNVKKTKADYPGRNINATDGDPYVDILESLDEEEMILAYRKGELDPAKAPEYRDIFKFLQKLSTYGGKGYLGLDSEGQYEQFITQKAVMMFQGSSLATRIAKDMKDLPSDKQFQWGVFPYPNFEKSDTPYVDTPTRGSGGVGFKIAVAKSTPEREAAAIDFLRYIMSPERASYIVEKGEPIGPSAIQGVKGSDVFDAFAQVKGTSNWFYYLGLDSEGEDQYRRALQEFLLGKLDMGSFLEEYSTAVNGAQERAITKGGIDLDPNT